MHTELSTPISRKSETSTSTLQAESLLKTIKINGKAYLQRKHMCEMAQKWLNCYKMGRYRLNKWLENGLLSKI